MSKELDSKELGIEVVKKKQLEEEADNIDMQRDRAIVEEETNLKRRSMVDKEAEGEEVQKERLVKKIW